MRNAFCNTTPQHPAKPPVWWIYFLLLIPLFLLQACGEAGASHQAAPQRSSEKSFDTAYQPPRFQAGDRNAKIREAAPRLEAIFRDYAEENHYPGFVYGIVLDDSLIFAGSYGVTNLETDQAVSRRSLFHIASMTKSFTSMAILKLRDEGRLSLLDPVEKYIPEFGGQVYLTEDAPRVTVKNLMTMSSGLPEDNPWADRQLEETDDAFMEMIEDGFTFSTIPSQEYEYSNTGYAMLGTIINNVTGGTYQEYITDEILLPLGMRNTVWEYEDAPDSLLAQGYRWEDERFKEEPMLHSGAFGAIGGLITSLEDFSKYVAYHLSAYPPRNGPETGPVRRASLREMHQMTFPRLYPDVTRENGDPCPIILGYGYGFRIQKNCEGMVKVAHSGGLPGFGSEYRFFPDYGLGIISFANRTYAGTGDANAQVELLLRREDRIEPRERVASPILQKRKEELQEWLATWDEQLADEIMAENFFLDRSLEHRQREIEEVLDKAGAIESASPIRPRNQLRGQFTLHGSEKDAEVFFTLSPEKDPKVQAVYVWIAED